MKHDSSSVVWLCKNRKHVSTYPLRLDPSQNVRINAPSNALKKSHTTSLGDFAANLFHWLNHRNMLRVSWLSNNICAIGIYPYVVLVTISYKKYCLIQY